MKTSMDNDYMISRLHSDSDKTILDSTMNRTTFNQKDLPDPIKEEAEQSPQKKADADPITLSAGNNQEGSSQVEKSNQQDDSDNIMRNTEPQMEKSKKTKQMSELIIKNDNLKNKDKLLGLEIDTNQPQYDENGELI